MANWSRRLQDGEIVQYLMNLDESECEDIDEEDEEDLNLEQEDIFEEVIPRPLDESDWESSDDEPLFSIARANTARRSINRPLRWDHTKNFENSFSDLNDDPPLVDPVTVKPTLEYFSRYIDPCFFETIAHCTNINSVRKTGKSINTDAEEIKTFMGVSIAIGIFGHNQFMGGIDLLDRIIGKYPMRGRTGKWTVRAIYHFFDFSAAAAWIEYREDATKFGLPRKRIKQYLDFKMDLAKHLIYGSQVSAPESCPSPSLQHISRNSPRSGTSSPGVYSEPEEDIVALPSNRKRTLVQPLPHEAKRLKEAQHLPICVKGNQNNRSKYRLDKYSQLTFVKCSTCNIFLCFNVNRNCFLEFHSKHD